MLQELPCRWNQSRWFLLCNMHFLLLHFYQYCETVLQLKRTNVGIALVANPRVLFLDEPTSGKQFAAGCADAASSCRCASAINIKHAVLRWPRRCSSILHKCMLCHAHRQPQHVSALLRHTPKQACYCHAHELPSCFCSEAVIMWVYAYAQASC